MPSSKGQLNGTTAPARTERAGPDVSNRNHRGKHDRSKTGPTSKRAAKRPSLLRAFTASDAAYANLDIAIRSVKIYPREAIKDALEALDFSENPAHRRELIWLADRQRTVDEYERHCDVLAARYPDDRRWNAWRRYRGNEAAGLN